MSKEVKEDVQHAIGEYSEGEASPGSGPKNNWRSLTPVIACGAGLFSDGYLNNVVGSVSTILKKIYGKEYKNSKASKNIPAIAFAGFVVGMLFFGYTSDRYSRKWSLLVSTLIMIVFAILSAGAYGGPGNHQGLFAAIAAYRFFVGIGLGGEYPAGSVGAAEGTAELKSGTRNWWFVMFTNVQIDLGFVVGALVPMLVVLATTENHLRAAWRICLGIGVIPPLSLLYLRAKLEEPEAFKRNSTARTKTPWLLALKFYWSRLLTVSLIWFLYNWTSYSFGIYFSDITSNLEGVDEDGKGGDTRLWVDFGWSTLITFFYLPGAIIGSWLADMPALGPRKTLAYFATAQGIVGFILAGCYGQLLKKENVGGFVVVYGIFLALGEIGPGDNIGLLASKTSATSIRGKYYGIAAAVGKAGAFTGTYLFKVIQDAAGPEGDKKFKVKRGQNPVFISSTFAILIAALAFFCLPNVGQDSIEEEDQRFKLYLESHGFDTTQMGLNRVRPEVSEVVESKAL